MRKGDENVDQKMYQALYQLIAQDEWTEELLDDAYFYAVLRYLLSPRETEIVCMKVGGYSNEEIKRMLGYKHKNASFSCVISEIKRKYKDRYFVGRIDNQRYGWVRMLSKAKAINFRKKKRRERDEVKDDNDDWIVGGDFGNSFGKRDGGLGSEEREVCGTSERGDREESGFEDGETQD